MNHSSTIACLKVKSTLFSWVLCRWEQSFCELSAIRAELRGIFHAAQGKCLRCGHQGCRPQGFCKDSSWEAVPQIAASLCIAPQRSEAQLSSFAVVEEQYLHNRTVRTNSFKNLQSVGDLIFDSHFSNTL